GRLRDRAADDLRVCVSVHTPRFLVRARIERTLLAVGDGFDAAGLDAERDEVVLGRGGAAGAKRQVVLAGAAFVGVAGDEDAHVRVLAQPGGLALEHRAGLGGQVEAVVAEEDAVADGDAEIFSGPRRRALRGLR